MTDYEKLININLQIEHNKNDLNPVKGFKLYLFEALYLIQQYHGRYKFLDILLTIFEFIQLIAFPMDKIFDESWGNHWVKTIGNTFRFSQLIYFWKGTSFFIISYIMICIYMVIFLSIFFYVLIKSVSKASIHVIKFLVMLFQIQTILNVPFLRTLFSVFICKNDIFEGSSEIKCKSGIHIILIVISTILIMIYKLIILIFHSTFYEFGVQPNKLKSGYGSSTEILLDLTKLILIIIYQFISHQMALSIITLVLSIILLFHFLIMQPYSSGFTMKLYLSLYSLFCWSCILCIASILLKNSNFKSGIVLLILGYPLILIIICLQEIEFSIDKYFSIYLSNARGGYNSLLEIEYFLKLEDSLTEKIKTKEFKLLFSYITDYEAKCTDENCHLKSFMKIPFKTENFETLKILLLQHAELLYKRSISKYPNNIKLRIGYILFLFKKLNKKLKGKNEIILLDRFDINWECSYLIYNLKKFINNSANDKDGIKEIINNEKLYQSMSSKEIAIEIKSLIEKILNDYVSFWNIMLTHDRDKNENFIRLSHLGEDIKSLNRELHNNIKSYVDLDLLDQETIKIYIQYLKEIINNNEKANIFNNKISDDENIKHQYDELNFYELNFNELSRNEDYKYIIINLLNNKIYNVSFPVCKIFGYTKEELIGVPFTILFPEIYKNERKLFFQKKIEDYKEKLLIKNNKINSEAWIDNSFAIDKAQYLVPIKLKWFLISNEDDKIYGLGNIFLENKKLINDLDQETVYILTDKNLIIQNFSSNAQKILRFDSSDTIINCNISNYITELNENMINEFELRNEKEESNISNTKKKSRKSRRMTIYIKTDILKKYNYLNQNSMKVIHWKSNDTIKENNALKNSNFDINNNNHEFTSSSIKSPRKGRSSENLIFLDKNKINNSYNNDRNTPPTINKGINFTNIYSSDMNKFKFLKETNSKEKENPNLLKQKEQMLKMIVKETKFNDHKVGYIFMFKLYINKEEEKKNINDGMNNLASSQDIKNMNISEISLMSFGEDKKNIITVPKTFSVLILILKIIIHF